MRDMHNHSNVWKNITMIIFYIFLIFLSVLVFFQFRTKIYLQIDGTKIIAKFKFYFWEFSIKGDFFLISKKEKALNASEKFLKIKVLRNIFNRIKKMKKERTLSKKTLLKILKSIKIEKLYIYEEIGLGEPFGTALAVPAISLITTLPLNLLNLNYNDYKYTLKPAYLEYKFNCSLDVEFSFSIIKIICCKINEKLHKLIIKKRRRL